ncbi:YcjF family protein [Acanthopleuribacter pedis]|uniref:DUF697 domain-containing protein n=1 Tax=Acanthopleuribacter pedis TaxID=442870 RepID=A0A8J7U5D0_9BACT|nr:DUF697 domain-containing protein [Acanthopleuribacter pedis]MBO1321602.1 DUF697 domain-containing protein [Acanthopleuribacter pedis]
MSDSTNPDSGNNDQAGAPRVKRKRRRLYETLPEATEPIDEPAKSKADSAEASKADEPVAAKSDAADSDAKAEEPVAAKSDAADSDAKAEEPVAAKSDATAADEKATGSLRRGGTAISSQYRIHRELKARNIVKNHVLGTMTLAMVPVPIFDVLVVSGSQVEMVEKLADLYDVKPRRRPVRTILAALLAGLGSYGLSSLSAYSFSKVVPGWRWFAAGAAMPLAAGAVTYAVGTVLLQHLEAGGTLEQLDVRALRADYQQNVEKGYALAKQWSGTPSPSS